MAEKSELWKTITRPYRIVRKELRLKLAKWSGVPIGKPAAPAETKPLSDYLTPIINFKNNYPVNSIRIDGHFLWPMLRGELYVQAVIASARQKRNRGPFNPHQTQLCSPEYISYDMIEEYRRYRGMKSAADLPAKSIDFLFFVNLNSVDLNETENGFYNRLTDPIYRAACKIGTAEKIEIIKASSPGVFKREKYVYPATAIVPEYVSETGNFNRAEYPNDLTARLNKSIPFMQFTSEQICTWVDWQIHMMNFFKRILEKYAPKVVFCHPYYYYAPLILAARQMGIRVVDLQHGMMAGENTLSYDNWQEIPPEGYHALPDYFWVWGQQEYNRLWDVFDSGKPNRPRPIVGGYPWIDMSQEISPPDAVSQLDRELARFPHKRKVLVTLQIFAELPPVIRELINRTQDEVLWIVRHHPKTRTKLSPKQFGSNVHISDAADSIVLSSLFPKVDLHFSETSTSVIEADYFGVYNYICSEGGLANYGNYIKAGLAGYCTNDNVAEIIQEIREGAIFDKKPRLNYINQIEIGDVLTELRDGKP